MVIAEKSKLVRRIFTLGTVLDDAKRELDDVLNAVLLWAPEEDPRPAPRGSEPLEIDPFYPEPPEPTAGPLPIAELVTPTSSISGLPTSLDERPSSSDEKEVYYETRTVADFEIQHIVPDIDAEVPDSD